MIKLENFILSPDTKRTKVKFNMNAADWNKRAWDLLLEDSPEWLGMNRYKTKHPNNNLNHADYLIALAQYYPYGSEYFVFGGLFQVRKMVSEIFNGFGNELTLMDNYREYIKRLIIRLDKPVGRDLYNRKYDTLQKQLNPEVYEIAPNVKLGHFPGYQNVSLKHKDLVQIFSRNEPGWKQALSNVKGVYVITDTSSGRLYIGSASGNSEGIWQRWTAYANGLTGGNAGIFEVLDAKGNEHIMEHFKYSILEIFDTKTKVETIIERENYWKNVFATKAHGMNCN